MSDTETIDSVPKEETTAPKKRGGSKPILKVSGIGRVDNNVKSTLFLPINPINQKNYYTEYLKRDDQILAYRTWNEEQKRLKELKDKEKAEKSEQLTATAPVEDVTMPDADEEAAAVEDETLGSKTIVIHPGSRNLRIGLASHAFPKTVPNVIAHKVRDSRQQDPISMEILDDDYNIVQKDLRERMRFYKRRILPNSHDLVVGFNSRVVPETIADHNDPYRVEWTSPEELNYPSYMTGERATKIPPDDKVKYELKWPIQHGSFNEKDYTTPQQILGDVSLILIESLEEYLNITFNEYKQYNVVLIIPDLYDKVYVSNMIKLVLDMGFSNVCILQESMAATFGAGISTACIIDVGAQKTSVACVEEGMCITDSRVKILFGGDDITIALAKLLMRSNFPYSELDLNKTYDWQLIQDLKHRFTTTNDADIAVQLYTFYHRSPNNPTKKYDFKTFDEVMLAPLGLFYPQIFNSVKKLSSRYNVFPRSLDVYDSKPNDPVSDAQFNIYKGTLAVDGLSYTTINNTVANSTIASTANGTPASSQPGTPAPDQQQQQQQQPQSQQLPRAVAQSQAIESIDTQAVPLVGLEKAIIESVTQAAARSPLSNEQTFYENLMIVGGGAAKLSGFNSLLTDRIAMWRDHQSNVMQNGAHASPGEVTVMPVPREMDPELITWKGGGVYAKLKIVNEVWISARDWDLLGSRCLQYKALFVY